MKLYVSIIAKEGRSARPVLVSSDPDLIAAIGKHLAERFGVELSAQIRMLPLLEPKRPEQPDGLDFDPREDDEAEER